MVLHSKRLAIAIGLVASTLSISPVPAQQTSITVFAAASMRNAINDINAAFTKATNIKTVSSYAASSALARQIEHGAPADIFISADIPWMDYVQKRNLVRTGTRFNLADNRLVLIAPKDSKPTEAKIRQGFDLAALAGKGRIATGDVKAVPAGRYAKAALEKLGMWDAAESKLAMVENVRAALLLVARGEAVLGIVYETDAKIEPGVRIVGRFPEDSHPAIVYPVAATAQSRPGAIRYCDFLQTDASLEILVRYGFTAIAKPAS